MKFKPATYFICSGYCNRCTVKAERASRFNAVTSQSHVIISDQNELLGHAFFFTGKACQVLKNNRFNINLSISYCCLQIFINAMRKYRKMLRLQSTKQNYFYASVDLFSSSSPKLLSEQILNLARLIIG